MMFKKWLVLELGTVLLAVLCSTVQGCQEKAMNNPTDAPGMATKERPAVKDPLGPSFKDYWYKGKAEITSYALEQVRYGETRKGKAVMVFVTEPFDPDQQVKADRPDKESIPVLKLNATKKFLTGIYPYSIMSSSFYPVHNNGHALKISFSAQEWCGQVYMQLNNRDSFHIRSHSYFQKEADQEFSVEKVVLENELWNQLRIDPNSLPQGDFMAVPSFEHIRLAHKETKPYKASGSLKKGETLDTYTLSFPELGRTLAINYGKNPPFLIDSWSETFVSGYGDNAQTMTSTAKKIKTINTPYWQQNRNEHVYLRDSLGL